MEKKFDFKTGKGVLIRYTDNESDNLWHYGIFSDVAEYSGTLWVNCVGDSYEAEDVDIIPFEGNEHLCGTSDPYEPEKWKPKYRDRIYGLSFDYDTFLFKTSEGIWVENEYTKHSLEKGWILETEEEAQAFCDKLNEAIENVK